MYKRTTKKEDTRRRSEAPTSSDITTSNQGISDKPGPPLGALFTEVDGAGLCTPSKPGIPSAQGPASPKPLDMLWAGYRLFALLSSTSAVALNQHTSLAGSPWIVQLRFEVSPFRHEDMLTFFRMSALIQQLKALQN
jgi:hypothetical protein